MYKNVPFKKKQSCHRKLVFNANLFPLTAESAFLIRDRDGIFAINIHKKIYAILVKMFGECNEKILLTKSSRNNYVEYIYVWTKS